MPCAWLPEEKATTPLARSAAESDTSRHQAPRSLNAPIGCSDSALAKIVVLPNSKVNKGVGKAILATALAAFSTPEKLGILTLQRSHDIFVTSATSGPLHRGHPPIYAAFAAPWDFHRKAAFYDTAARQLEVS
jgi:hypothetical protein